MFNLRSINMFLLREDILIQQFSVRTLERNLFTKRKQSPGGKVKQNLTKTLKDSKWLKWLRRPKLQITQAVSNPDNNFPPFEEKQDVYSLLKKSTNLMHMAATVFLRGKREQMSPAGIYDNLEERRQLSRLQDINMLNVALRQVVRKNHLNGSSITFPVSELADQMQLRRVGLPIDAGKLEALIIKVCQKQDIPYDLEKVYEDLVRYHGKALFDFTKPKPRTHKDALDRRWRSGFSFYNFTRI